MAGTSVLVSSLSVLLMMMMTAQSSVIKINLFPDSCEGDTEHKDCGCKVTCNDLAVTCTDKTCQPGCYCKDGKVDDGHGECVEPETCCTGNTTYSDMGSNCGNDCPAPDVLPPSCPEIRYPGCFCRPGYRSYGSGRCFLPEDCPKLDYEPYEY